MAQVKTRKRKARKHLLFCLLSALLLILSFPKLELEFLAWFALVPWFFLLQRETPGRAFFFSYLVGLFFFSGTLYWINYVSRLGFTALVLYLSLYFAFFGLVFSILFNIRWRTLLLIPAVWVALEYARSHLFTGFGWALLGYSQYRHLALIQISDLTGVYGVSFLVVMVNTGIWQALARWRISEYRWPKKMLPSLLLPLFSVILVLGYGWVRLKQLPPGREIKVAVIQGNIPQWLKWKPQARDYILSKYKRLTEEALDSQPELIIWPETSLPGYLEEDPYLWRELSALSRRMHPVHLLVGNPRAAKDRKSYNSATLLFRGLIIQRYDKLHLVPFGEFIPRPDIFSRFSFAGLIGNFVPGKEYTVFTLFAGQTQVAFSVLICFEDVFAHLARGFVQAGAHLLINMTNDAWFEDSSEPYQHLQASVFRAVENRVNLVRSANTGVSCFINPWGKILSRLRDELGRDVMIAGQKTEKLQVVSLVSFYTKFGDVFAWLCLAMSGFALGKRRKRR